MTGVFVAVAFGVVWFLLGALVAGACWPIIIALPVPALVAGACLGICAAAIAWRLR